LEEPTEPPLPAFAVASLFQHLVHSCRHRFRPAYRGSYSPGSRDRSSPTSFNANQSYIKFGTIFADKEHMARKPTQRTRGQTKDKVDRFLFLQYLWKYRERGNLTHRRPGEYAELLGIRNDTMSEIFREMCEKGMLRKAGHWKYHVTDPDLFLWEADEIPQLPEIG
jgi:hypothetical protein